MTDIVMISKATRTDIGQIVETEDCIDRIEVDLDMKKIIGEIISEIMQGILTDRMAEESIEIIKGMKVIIIACLHAKPHINNKEVKLRIKPVWWTLVWLQLVNLLRLLCHNISLFIAKICCHGNQLFKYKI